MVDSRARRGPLALYANLKMAQKLLVGFLAVSVLMVGVGVVGLAKLTAVETNLEYVYAQNLQSITWLHQAQDDATTGQRYVLEVAFVTDPAVRARTQTELVRLDALVDASWAKYVSTDMVGREKLRDDFNATMRVYRKVRDTQILPLIEAGRTADFVALHAKLVVPLINRISADLAGLVETENKVAAQHVAASAADYRFARNLIIGIILAALALSIGLAIGIGRMISGPLHQTVEALEGMAKGRLDLRLDIDTRDEVGQMARALNRSMLRLREATEADQRLASIVKYSQDVIISRGVDDKIMSWNPAAEQMFGYSSQEIIGKSASLLTPKDRAGELDVIGAKIRAGQAVEHFETTRVRKDGSVVPVSLTISPILDADGTLIGASTIAHDLTRQREASMLARSMIEASLDSLVSISPDHKIADANQATVRLTGVPRDKLIGTSFSGYFTEAEKAEEIYHLVLEQGSVTDYPLTVSRRDGRETSIEVLYNASLYRDTSGRVLGVFAAARDVTKQRQAQRQLQEANDAIRGFTAAAAHDLRSPLAAITGFSSLLSTNWETFTDEDRRKFVGSIDRQSQNMARLVDDLFTSASIEGGGLAASPEPIVVGEAIHRCLDAGSGDAASVAVSCPPDLVVRVDPHHLERILDNYVQNAFKYGEPPVRIEATRVGDMVEVRVLDQGPGVPPGFVSKLFGRFARADTPATRAKKGTGLGLSIVRGLAEVNGGRARYEPNVTGGSCFVVELPAGERPGA